MKHVQGQYTENCQTDGEYIILISQKIQYYKYIIYSQLRDLMQNQENSPKVLFFGRNWNTNSRIYMKVQRT